MGITEEPEIKLARRLFKRHSLQIPFDIDDLVKNYASLIYKPIPIKGVDGVSINIKVSGKTPKIVVNTLLPETRQKFTIAHELGHIIIPWHLGTIIDEIYPQDLKDHYYKQIEHEANKFAAEILMPRDWIIEEYNMTNSLADLHSKIAKVTQVSDQAAAIRMKEVLPSQIVFCAETGGIIWYSGKTNRTLAHIQDSGDFFNQEFYSHYDQYSVATFGINQYHWWKLSEKVNIPTVDKRDWREILDSISQDINPEQEIEKFKKSINGIIAAANGETIKRNNHNIGSVISAAIYRLERPDLKSFIKHPDFEQFIKKRVLDFFDKKKNRTKSA